MNPPTTAQGDIFDSVAILTVYSLKSNGINPELDVTKYTEKINAIIVATKAKIGEQNLNKAMAYLNHKEAISKIVNICISKIQMILKDGKIDLNDTSYFIDMIREIYQEVNTINQSDVTISLSSETLIELCGFLIKTVLTYMISDEQALNSGIMITQSSIQLIAFSMSKTTWTCAFKGFSCCQASPATK